MSNNNVSHCERLGIIRKTGANSFVLTTIGKKYFDGDISFDSLFLNQILLYTLEEGEEKLFPYRFMLEFLMQCKTMNYIEFLYSVYSAQAGDQDAVRDDLNEKYGTGFSKKDVWTDRTTAGNQYRFMLNHLLLFSKYLNIDLKTKEIRVNDSKLGELRSLLDSTEKCLLNADFKYGETLWVTEGDNLK